MVVEERLRAPAPSHHSVQAEGPVGLTEPLTTSRRRFCLPSTLAQLTGIEPVMRETTHLSRLVLAQLRTA